MHWVKIHFVISQPKHNGVDAKKIHLNEMVPKSTKTDELRNYLQNLLILNACLCS